MLSTDLENLANALEQMKNTPHEDNNIFLEIFCNNLQSLAQRVQQLESMAVPPSANPLEQEDLPLQ